MTWKDIKLITLQKMYSADGNNIPNEDSTKDYLASMPAAANEGLLMICTSRRPILKSINLPKDQGEVVGNYRVYKMSDLVDDFHQFYQEVYYTETTRSRTTDYMTEANDTILIDKDRKGTFTIYYSAYPEEITPSTSDDYVLTVPPDVQAILPLYMASQLFKEDDNGIATSLRNEFEVALDRLVISNPLKKEVYRESGW